MSDNSRVFSTDEAPTPAGIMNNPLLADAQPVSTKSFGEHEITVMDDGSTIVNGEHVCYDAVGTTEELVDDQVG